MNNQSFNMVGSVQPSTQYQQPFGAVQQPFGAVQPSEDCSTKELLKKMEQMGKKINKILESIDKKIINNNYILCKSHKHPLKETTYYKLGPEYMNGYSCNICKYCQTNKDETFYHCEICYNTSKCLIDFCQKCIHLNLK